jgi:hypothetical protein
MTMDDTDTQAIRGNLTKARKAWKMISRLLRSENMEPRVCGMFFQAVVQAVLLYGSETWVLTDSALRCLEGFFYRAACCMASKNRLTKNERTGEWTHPDKAKLFAEVGLSPLKEYIAKRRDSIGAHIRDRPILDLCRRGERQRGTSNRPWWWEQQLAADVEREEDASSVVSEDAQAAGPTLTGEDSA